MKRISEYQGCFLNHLEGVYRKEDRDLAIELAEALGLTVTEMRFTATSNPLLAVHPNGQDRDPTNNIIFLFEMPELQRRVLDLMERNVGRDEELGAAMEAYRTAARAMPPIMPHFGLRYGSTDELAAVVDRLENNLSEALKARIGVFEVPPYKAIDGLPDIRQVFVRTDVFGIGAIGFDQAIELQVVRAA